MVFWKMSLLHWLAKPTHQTLYREKIIGEIFWRQWCHRDWTFKTVSEIIFCFICTTGFVWIVIRTWFMETILLLIINVPTLSLSLLFPFLWLFCSIVVINTSLFCSVWHLLCIIMFSVLSQLFLCHFLLLLLLLLLFCCCFFIALADAAVVACCFLLLLSLLLYGCCCVHCYRCQGGCWCCCYCCYCCCCVVVTSVASLLCPFFLVFWFH